VGIGKLKIARVTRQLSIWCGWQWTKKLSSDRVTMLILCDFYRFYRVISTGRCFFMQCWDFQGPREFQVHLLVPPLKEFRKINMACCWDMFLQMLHIFFEHAILSCWLWIVHEHLEWFIMPICQVMMSKCSIQDISPNWGQRFRVRQQDAISRSTEGPQGSHVIGCDAKDSLGSQW